MLFPEIQVEVPPTHIQEKILVPTENEMSTGIIAVANTDNFHEKEKIDRFCKRQMSADVMKVE